MSRKGHFYDNVALAVYADTSTGQFVLGTLGAIALGYGFYRIAKFMYWTCPRVFVTTVYRWIVGNPEGREPTRAEVRATRLAAAKARLAAGLGPPDYPPAD